MILSIVFLQNNFFYSNNILFTNKNASEWAWTPDKAYLTATRSKLKWKYIYILRTFLKGYAANRNEENVYIGTKNKQKELLWIDKQTKRGNKNAEKVVGQKKSQINISL